MACARQNYNTVGIVSNGSGNVDHFKFTYQAAKQQ